MKVIDKRTEKKKEEWKVGDLICFWNYKESKKYGLIMKIIDRTDDSSEEQWQLGDVIKSNRGLLALIVQNDDSNYCLMSITSSDGHCYSTSPFGRARKMYSSLEALYINCYPRWHKVNAKLVIE